MTSRPSTVTAGRCIITALHLSSWPSTKSLWGIVISSPRTKSQCGCVTSQPCIVTVWSCTVMAQHSLTAGPLDITTRQRVPVELRNISAWHRVTRGPCNFTDQHRATVGHCNIMAHLSLLSPWEATRGVLCPVQGSPVLERHRSIRVSSEEGYEDDLYIVLDTEYRVPER